jgi:LysM repeat protein
MPISDIDWTNSPYGPPASVLAEYERQRASVAAVSEEPNRNWFWVFILVSLALLAIVLGNNLATHQAVNWDLKETVSTPADKTAVAPAVSPVAASSNATAATEPQEFVTITVKRGDTLWALVGPRWPAVCQANGLANCDLILIGQKLTLPVKNQKRSE